MEWQDWKCVDFLERGRLPAESGIYVVVDSENFVWYVGKARNLQNRWLGRGHHRYPQLIRSNKKLRHRIYWKTVLTLELDEKEQFYIRLFEPELNGRKVKNYLPKEAEVNREIKRLLKVLNKNTFLFPVIRSIIAGEYTDDLGNRCVVVVTNLNDFSILAKSSRKRYSQKVRNSWIELETYCASDEKEYKPLIVPAYTFQGYRFEFIAVPEIIFYFEDSFDERIRWLQEIDMFDVPIKALKGLGFFKNLNLEEAYGFVSSDNKRTFKDVAYLKYISSDLSFISQESQSFTLPAK
ncbi:GIY-YIG nuclease family protein [Leptolyngbya sp. CCNP1308]|uniref:GIY-YIG nuclease family protein n=1 Tax=Leptolyngbya sp. CCNP1308 TaxID=3110255 RepID=UPI002B1EFD1B|nr:GIY-YIG nuclease family protein [Leptolyngbya sp. CCNP1308]MEA5447636.1 GIY-YIG nuclease family protein [Leptolyngbya sp. CCNP1308]